MLRPTPGRSSCCSETDACQFWYCVLKPVSALAEYLVPAVCFPKFRSDQGPHSPLATGLSRSQSGAKFRVRGSPTPNRLSFHVRLVVRDRLFAGLPVATLMISG